MQAFAGRPLPLVAATFRGDEPGMQASHYRAGIDWDSDGTVDDVGQVWSAGNGNRVVTGMHTYAEPGTYTMIVTITDEHDCATGTCSMTTTTYSTVQVDPTSASGGGGGAGRLPPDGVAALLREEPAHVAPRNLPAVEKASPAANTPTRAIIARAGSDSLQFRRDAVRACTLLASQKHWMNLSAHHNQPACPGSSAHSREPMSHARSRPRARESARRC